MVQRVGEMVKHASREIYAIYGRQERSAWAISVWANVNRKGHYNKNHAHPGSTWSGVYVVDTGNAEATDTQSGMVALINPNMASVMSFYRNAIPLRYSVVPEPGLMLLWPSYMIHMVHPHQGPRPRVSISFNVKRDPYP